MKINKYLIKHLIIGLLVLQILCGCVPQIVKPGFDIEAMQSSKLVMASGTEALRKGDLASATHFYELAFQLGRHAEALDGLGCVALSAGKHKEALRYFNEALERAPQLSPIYGHIAAVLEIQGDMVNAEQHFKRGLFQKPSDIQLRFEYAQFLKRRGKTEQSKILIAQVRSMIPKPLRFGLKRGFKFAPPEES